MDSVIINVPEIGMIKGNPGVRIIDSSTKVVVGVNVNIRPPKIKLKNIPTAMRQKAIARAKKRVDDSAEGFFDPLKDPAYVTDYMPTRRFAMIGNPLNVKHIKVKLS